MWTCLLVSRWMQCAHWSCNATLGPFQPAQPTRPRPFCQRSPAHSAPSTRLPQKSPTPLPRGRVSPVARAKVLKDDARLADAVSVAHATTLPWPPAAWPPATRPCPDAKLPGGGDTTTHPCQIREKQMGRRPAPQAGEPDQLSTHQEPRYKRNRATAPPCTCTVVFPSCL